MGRRQQVFLIARLPAQNGVQGIQKYRCIAAYHQQWTYGIFALQAANRFLTLVKQKENAEIIREELLGIDGKYGTDGAKPGTEDAPCPFSLGLLGMSWDTDLIAKDVIIQGVSFETSTLSAQVGCWDTDNDDGIAVIDVTYPDHPAYCFVTDERPLSGSQYVGRAKTKLLANEALVTYGALVESWPEEFPQKGPSVPAAIHPKAEDDSSSFSPSLADASLRAAVLQSIKSANTSTIGACMASGKGYAHICYAAVPLLKQTLKEITAKSSALDLSGMDLSDEQLVDALPDYAHLISLNLSRLVRITSLAVEGILQRHPKLRRLVLMNCPAISSDDMQLLLSSKPELFRGLDALMHPAIFRLGGVPPSLRPAITFVAIHEMYPFLRGISLPLLSPANVVQGLGDFLTAMLACNYMRFNASPGGAMESAFSTASRNEGKTWYERAVVAVPRLDLRLVDPDVGGWLFVLERKNVVSKGWAFLRFSPGREKSTSAATSSGNEVVVAESEPQQSSAAEDDLYGSGKLPRLRDMQHEIHDFRSFLRVMEQEGRPLPSEEMISRVEAMLQEVCGEEIADDDPLKWDPRMFAKCPLMKPKLANEIIDALDFYRALMWRRDDDD